MRDHQLKPTKEYLADEKLMLERMKSEYAKHGIDISDHELQYELNITGNCLAACVDGQVQITPPEATK